MLQIGDGRGSGPTKIAAKNRKNIIDFFTRNPGATKTQCATALGLTLETVMRHVKAINAE